MLCRWTMKRESCLMDETCFRFNHLWVCYKFRKKWLIWVFLCSEYNVMCLCRHLKLKFFCICFKGEKDKSCKEYYNAISSCFPIERYEFTIVWIILLNIHLKVIWRHCFGCSKLANLVLKTSRSILLASEGSFTPLRQTRVTYNQIFNKSSFCLA